MDIIINFVLGSKPQPLTTGNNKIINIAARPPKVVILYPIISGTGVIPLTMAATKAAIPLKSHRTKINSGTLVEVPKQK